MMRPDLVTLPFSSLADSSAGTWQLRNHRLSSLSSSPSLSLFLFPHLLLSLLLLSLPSFSFYPLSSLFPLFLPLSLFLLPLLPFLSPPLLLYPQLCCGFRRHCSLYNVLSPCSESSIEPTCVFTFAILWKAEGSI